MKNIKKLSSNEDNIKTTHAENIANYIQKNCVNKLTLRSIAESLDMNRSYLSRLFKEVTGYTVMEYVKACRLMRAKYLLEAKPDTIIRDIANESGFESAAHFSRYFRQQEGITASEYRRIRLHKK